MRIKNEKKDQAEEAKAKVEQEEDLNPQQRYKKLCDLLSKSKFYSSFLLEKMEREDEESKSLKSKNLAGRTSGKATKSEQVCSRLKVTSELPECKETGAPILLLTPIAL